MSLRTRRFAIQHASLAGCTTPCTIPSLHEALTMIDRTASERIGSSRRAIRPKNCGRRGTRSRGGRGLTYGFMGRTPDYKASFMATLGANPEFYAPYEENARRWYDVCLEGAVPESRADQSAGGSQPAGPRSGGCVSARRAGNGCRRHRERGEDARDRIGADARDVRRAEQRRAVQAGRAEDFALVFIAPMDTPGTRLLCRASYEQQAHSPFDHPLSSRFDENDAVLIFDEALIPWENFLVYRDVERANAFYPASGFFNRFNLQAGTRLAVKLDFMTGLLARGSRPTGPTVSRRAGRAGRSGRVADDDLGDDDRARVGSAARSGGSMIPKIEYAAAMRIFGTSAWPAIKDIMENVLGGAPLVTPRAARIC